MTPQVKRLVFMESFLGNFLFTLCMISGVGLTSAVTAGVTMAGIPAAVAVMSWFFLKEQVPRRTWAAVVLAVAGIALFAVAQPGPGAHGGAPGAGGTHPQGLAWLGQLLLIGAVLCEAAYSVIGKKLTGTLGPRRITALINLWGFVLATPLGLYTALQFDFSAVRPGMWLLLVFYALAASVWTVWLWMTGLKAVPAAQGGVFTVLLPVSAALVGVLVLGERFTALQLVAFGIAIASVVLPVPQPTSSTRSVGATSAPPTSSSSYGWRMRSSNSWLSTQAWPPGPFQSAD